MEALIALRVPGEAVTRIPEAEPASRFSTAYREHGRQLYGTALRLLRRPEDAEEAVQDAFLALHRHGPPVPADFLGGWLHRVLVNRCLDRIRRDRRWRDEELGERTRHSSREGLGLDLERAVARLPEKARLVFLLHDVEGWNHAELSRMLGLAEGTSKSQLFRARRMLRDLMRGTP